MRDINSGFHITPLTMAVAGVLWAVLAALGWRILTKQDQTQEAVTTLLTSQQYDRHDLDVVKLDIKQVQTDVRGIEQRLGKVEASR